MQVSSPSVMTGDLPAAYEAAKEREEPIFVPVSVYADDRGWSMMNQMQGVMGPQGQINYSVQFPGVVKAWHRHALQTDFWLVLMGHLKVGVYRERDQKAWSIVMGERKAGVLIIPPPLWHGATAVGADPAGLLYYVTHAYNAAKPDEDRRAHDCFPGFPWAVQHR